MDILDIGRISIERNITLELKTSSFTADMQIIQQTVTIKDIFDFTPQVDDKLFLECQARVPGDYEYFKMLGEGCFEFFNVTTFYLQEYLCYRFHYKGAENKTFNYGKLAYSLGHPGMIFSVSFDLDTFKSVDQLKAVVHSYKALPFKSSAFSPTFGRNYNASTGTAEFNSFGLTYSILTNRRLPAPYTTNCIDYVLLGYTSSNDCIKQCLTNKTLDSFQKLPFSTIVPEALDYKHITSADITNDTFSRLLNKFESDCRINCIQDDCEEGYTITRVTIEPAEDRLTFTVNVPREPSFTITFHAKLSITEYLIYIFSCFGTWFGISLISFNPFQLDFFKKKTTSSTLGEGKSLNSVPTKERNTSDMDIYIPSGVERLNSSSSRKDCSFCSYCFNTRSVMRKEIRDEITTMASLVSMVVSKRSAKNRGDSGMLQYQLHGPLQPTKLHQTSQSGISRSPNRSMYQTPPSIEVMSPQY